jgi:hypothetical protein
MPVPEATVYENNNSMLREHDVGTAGQVSAVKPEAIPHFMQHTANEAFRLSVLSLDRPHVQGPLSRSQLRRPNHLRCQIKWQIRDITKSLPID